MIREANAMQISVMSFNIQHCLNYRTRQIDFDLFAQVIRQSGQVSDAELSRMADQIYRKLESRISAERRRFGL